MADTGSSPVVEFYYDIVCPFAYLASTRITAVASRSGATVVWRPVLLGGIYGATSAPQGAAGSATDAMNATKRAAFRQAFARTRRRQQLRFAGAPAPPRKTPVAALRLLHALPDGDARAAASHALFRAYWVEGRDVADREVLLAVVRRALAGRPGARALVTPEAGGGAPARRALEAATADAVARGAPGVPGFWIPGAAWRDCRGRARQGRLYWGQDRLHFVEACLLRLSQGRAAGVRYRGLLPRCRELRELEEPVKLEFWFDFSSPWAYLGWTRLKYLQRTFGPQLYIELKPILLGALFKEIGAPQLPGAVISEQKRRYSLQDIHDWAEFWSVVDQQEGFSDEPIAFHWPDNFPIRSPTLLRCALASPECMSVLYKACWALNVNVSDEGTLKEVLDRGGYDAEWLLAKARSPAMREKLAANTRMAKDAGFCGVPTYRVFRRESDGSWKQSGAFVWGQDEINVVEDLIAGWEETSDEIASTNTEMVGTSPRARI
ncbi:protein disulfide [Xylariomycetidae sp. FL0641]|nr:protein disulfide [Xylariomycetidae sp. FL0641]